MPFLQRVFGRHPRADALRLLHERHQHFREVLENNNRVLELIADAEEKLGGEFIFDRQYLRELTTDLAHSSRGVVYSLNALSDNGYPALTGALDAIEAEVEAILEERAFVRETAFVLPLEDVSCRVVEVVGEKMARLGELRSAGYCRTPEGFVLSASACQRVLEELVATTDLGQWLDVRADGEESALDEVAARLQECLAGARLPDDVARAIRAAMADLEKEFPDVPLAVRSSALGEDSALSFAGLYRSVLGVPSDQVAAAYLEVLASLYAPAVMKYRRSNGLPPAQGLMAVGCLRMVEAEAAGVLYTLDPARPEEDAMLVTVGYGLGKLVVEGAGGTDRFVVSRRAPYEVLSRSLGRKEWKYMVRQGGGIEKVPVPPEHVTAPALADEKLAELAALAAEIETHWRGAQDLEWAVDATGEIQVLQARPLRVDPQLAPAERDLTEVLEQYPVLLRDRGEVACRGIGYGRVCLLDQTTPLGDLPEGAVLVVKNARPVLAPALAEASAVVTDVGATTGHLATIARELGVPMLVDTELATQVLHDRQEVTVDAEENIVYEGRVKELIHHSLLGSASFQEAPEFRLLRKVLRKVAALHLTDPDSPRFTPENCSTYHDVIRFAHEKAVEELTEHYPATAPGRGEGGYRLELAVPLDLVLIDLGGGLAEEVEGKTVTPEQITSAPLRALLDGLTAEGVWSSGPADMDLDGFMSSATRSAALAGPLAPRPRCNLALLSADYLNLNLKLGYHFNTVDCYLSEQRNSNFIHFRFAGGVTEKTRRVRRAEIIQQILEEFDFVVERKEDLVIGRVKKLSHDQTVERMEMTGRLIGFTRQLDVFLRDPKRVELCVETFLKGEYNPLPRSTEMESPVEVMILDDESIVCDRLKGYLEKSGYVVETFTESQQAIDRLRDKRFDVVVTDLKMEGPSGLDITHFVRRQRRGTQVIMITGYATMEAAREAEYGAVVDFLNKPFQLDALGAAVKKAAKKAVKLRGERGQ